MGSPVAQIPLLATAAAGLLGPFLSVFNEVPHKSGDNSVHMWPIGAGKVVADSLEYGGSAHGTRSKVGSKVGPLPSTEVGTSFDSAGLAGQGGKGGEVGDDSPWHGVPTGRF